MTSVKKSIAAVALSFGVLTPAAATADPPINGACEPTRMKFVASEALRFRTTSTTYTDLLQATVSFRQGGAKPSCVLVRFSANPQANRNMGLVAVLDGVEGRPLETQISDGADVAPTIRRFVFIFDQVPPGVHTVQMRYRMTSPGGMVDMNAHNTIVSFAP